jgi:predicted secreted hydrolase
VGRTRGCKNRCCPGSEGGLVNKSRRIGFQKALLALMPIHPASAWASGRSTERPEEVAYGDVIGPGRALTFPADFGAHPQARIEWWYLTGWLSPGGTATAAPPTQPAYGFQITFFRSRSEVAPNHPSRFAAKQLVFAHMALSDVASGRLRHDDRIARAGFGLVAAAPSNTQVQLRDWRLQRLTYVSPSDAATTSIYQTQVQSDKAGFALNLELATTQSVLLQGQNGYSRKGPQEAQASHYYSQPQLQARGDLQVNGKKFSVGGRAWLDHEWSDSLLDAQAVGWDWIGMNLFDGSALTAFRLRRQDGSTLYSGGSWRKPGGDVQNFAPHEVVFTAGRHWQSPSSGARYPVQWQVNTPAGSTQVRALFDAQELDSRASTGTIYWEGLSELLDPQRRRIGLGYLEMTGYARPLRI